MAGEEELAKLRAAVCALAAEVEAQEAEIAALNKKLAKAKEEPARLRSDLSRTRFHLEICERRLDEANACAPRAVSAWVEQSVRNWPIGDGDILLSPEGGRTAIIYADDNGDWCSATVDAEYNVEPDSRKWHYASFGDAWERAIALSTPPRTDSATASEGSHDA
jgi:hypothetical protein